MDVEIDEQKLTAFALGELDDGERGAVEAHVAADDTARRHVEEVRATARLLEGALAREAEDDPALFQLTELQHAAIERRLAGERDPLRLAGPAGPRGRGTRKARAAPQLGDVGEPGCFGRDRGDRDGHRDRPAAPRRQGRGRPVGPRHRARRSRWGRGG